MGLMLVIDGHNLIPKVPGMSLRAIDDEAQLIDLLQGYTRARRRPVLVFFDGAPPGQAREQAYGMVRARFVRQGTTADEAIRRYLVEQGGAARNDTVVSSDRQVQANARALHAGVISSEDFARTLIEAQSAAPGPTQPPSPGALDDWYKMFHLDPTQAEQPIEIKREKKPKPTKPGKGRKHHGFEKKG